MLESYLLSEAEFSPCRRWRYTLTRVWDCYRPTIAFIGLNPSTADEFVLDPTVTRCVNRAITLGFGKLVMLNLFAFRATDPRVMKEAGDPIGSHNDRFIVDECTRASTVVVAWGTHGSHRGRDRNVIKMLENIGCDVSCLGKNKNGSPRHPLYLPYDKKLEPFR